MSRSPVPGGSGGTVGGLKEQLDALEDDAPRKWVDIEAKDEDGNTALGLCVALGHAEGVRVIIEGGAEVSGGDKVGWTPLHWAAQNNDIPIAAYLLNHRASPSLASHKGLTPKDLVKRGKEGSAMRDILRSAEEAAEYLLQLERDMSEEGEGRESGSVRPSSRASSVASSSATGRERKWAGEEDKVEEERREREMLKRLELAKSSALHLEVDLNILCLDDQKKEGELTAQDEEDEDDVPAPFIWNRCEPDQMLVFTLDELPIIFDVIISNMKPVRTRKFRVTPATVIFLCARFAHYHGGQDLVEELFLSAIERIELAVHNRPDDMANCAFWLSNCLLLLYYLRKEPNLFISTADYQVHLCDLINEIYVFVIRDAERRIDKILEPAFLDYEALPGFEDVQFEGEWTTNRFVKKLTGRGKKAAPRPSSMALFADTVSGKDHPDAPSPTAPATPRHITSLLSSTLFILQLYEIPPSIVVQAFSQLFYWISCEIFNRLLSQRKYLCRSKAMQIRLNASTLEDWARLNRMPAKMASVHFTPLNQLLQWLQCLSSESTIDGLIGTIQSLRSLNPLQLRRAVREYRYEVDEPKMSEDCEQYLLQIQKQWERMRVEKTVEEVETSGGSQRSSSPVGSGSQPSVQSEVVRMIDEVFSDPSSFGTYTPPGGSEAFGELLNSRYMLPFAVPTSAEMLVNFRTKDAFGPFSAPTLPESGATTPRSMSTASAARQSSIAVDSASQHLLSDSSSILSTSSDAVEDDPRFIPTLPDEFFAVLDAAKAEAFGPSAPGQFATVSGFGFEGEGDDSPVMVQGEVGLFDWRASMPADISGDEGGEEDDDEGEVQATPKPPSGFSPYAS